MWEDVTTCKPLFQRWGLMKQAVLVAGYQWVKAFGVMRPSLDLTVCQPPLHSFRGRNIETADTGPRDMRRTEKTKATDRAWRAVA
jgi:hypothetical protein